jgi:hypothetical protein
MDEVSSAVQAAAGVKDIYPVLFVSILAIIAIVMAASGVTISWWRVSKSDELEAERTKVRKLERDKQMDKHEARMDKYESRLDGIEKVIADHVGKEGKIWDFTRNEFGKMQNKMHDMDVNIQSIKVLIEEQNKRRELK